MKMWEVYNKAKARELTEAWGEWLGKWQWSYFATYTIRDTIKVGGRFINRRVTTNLARRLIERYLKSSTIEKSGEYFYVVESNGAGMPPHIHMLVRGDQKLPRWKHGRNDVQRYKPDLGAKYYVVKHITSRYVDYDFKLDGVDSNASGG